MVAAGLEGDNQGAPASRIAGLFKGPHLSVGFASTGMKPFPNQSTLNIKNNGTNQRVRTGGPLR